MRIQSEYAKSFYDGFFDYVKKTGEIYSNLAEATYKPIEAAITKVQAVKE